MSTDSDSNLPWDDAYRRDLSSYESCAEKLKLLVEDILDEAGIEVVAVESRAKDLDSFVRKVERKKDKYKNPLADVTDLIGVRVIAYYLEDVDRIAKLLHKEFDVDPDNSTDKLEEMEPDRFGYRSVHYVLSLSKKRAGLAEWGVFGGKRAEVQLRTATQHAWAAVEHKLSYKRTREAPRDLRRRLTRLSALFELADEQFSVVRAELEKVEAQYDSDVRGGNLDIPVDTASLEAFVSGNEVVDDLVARARNSGMTIAPPGEDGYGEQANVDFRDLVRVLDGSGIGTIAELDSLLKDKTFMDEAIARLAPASSAASIRWRTPMDLLCALILFQTAAPPALVVSVYLPMIVELFDRARSETPSSQQAR